MKVVIIIIGIICGILILLFIAALLLFLLARAGDLWNEESKAMKENDYPND